MTVQSLPFADGDVIRGAGPAGLLSTPASLSPVDKAILGGLAALSAALLFWATRDMVLAAVVHQLAQIGQYLVPFMFVLGAGISAWRRRSRQNLLADVAARCTAEPYVDLSWQQFDPVVGELFRQLGDRDDESVWGGAAGGAGFWGGAPARPRARCRGPG